MKVKELIKELQEFGDISRFKPDEFARVCLRMAKTADSSVINKPEFASNTDLQAQNDELRANNSKLRESLRDACMYLACTVDISKYSEALESIPAHSLADIRAEAVRDYEASLSSFPWTAEEYIANKIKGAE